MIGESITWFHVDEQMPDSDRAVLVCTPSDKLLPVWLGFWDYEDAEWITVDAAEFDAPVRYWAEIPKGPA